MKYKNYIFDCGNVLLEFDHERLLDIYVGSNKIDREAVRDAVLKNWIVQDKDVTSLDYYNEAIKKLPERLHLAANKLVFHWKEQMREVKGMSEILTQLKNSGHNLILLSNMPDSFTYNHDDVKILKIFGNNKVFSFDAGMIKPNKDIFEYTLSKYNLDPKESLFIDDSLLNINGAKSVGLNTYQFNKNNPESFINFVKKIEEI